MTVFLLLALAATPAAQDTGYEERLIEWGLAQHERTREAAPEGKRIEEVLVASENIIAPSDPYPAFLNWIHVRTRESVIRREVLLGPGDTWDAHRVEETERNLRRLFLLAVVRVVAVQGKEGGVGLLVITKDRWSLRLSNAFTLIGSLLQYLQLQLIEVNFNGWGQQLAVNTVVRLDTFSVGQSFVERRLFGSRWYVGEAAALLFNRQTGALEGTVGSAAVGQPLITLDQEWAFLLDGSWNVRRRRVFRGANIWQLEYPGPGGTEAVPLVYDVREYAAEASVTRSFGRAVKLDVSGSLGGYSRQYTPPGLEAAQAAWLTANYLPRSENVTFVGAQVRAFPSTFRVLRNIDTFELSEDYQLGWRALAQVRYAVPLPFAPSHFVEVGGSVRYRLYAADDLLTVTVAGAVRLRPGLEPANQRLAFEVSNSSPQFWGGRLVTRLLVDVKDNDLDNRQLLLGGSTGLRGAFPEQLTGRNLVLGNIEYRAKPIELWTNWLGLVLFYDVGAAYDVAPVFVHTVGMGLRLLLPQLNREVLRLDFGVVINGPVPGADRLNATWGQVTDLRPEFLDSPL